MDVDRNELIDPEAYKRLLEENPEEAARFREVPERLARAARQKLLQSAVEGHAFVSRTSGGKLSKWAAEQRKLPPSMRGKRG